MCAFEKKFVSFVVFLFFVNYTSSQAPCQTPNGANGVCINIKQCQSLLILLRTRSNEAAIRTFLRNSQCGLSGSTPSVCCPLSRALPVTDNSENTSPSGPSTSENEDFPKDQPLRNSRSKLLRPPSCGFSNVTSTRIVGGVPAKLGQFPWIVSLGYRNSKNPSVPKWLCGGTLISDRHILTAGHCAYNRQDLYLAKLGELEFYSNDDGATVSDIPLSRATVHENYSPYTFTNDIAILTLEYPVNNPTVWPVCLPVDEPNRSKNFVGFEPVVAGWGNLFFNGPSSTALQVVKVPVVSNQSCKRAYGTKSVIDDRVLCAGYARGGKDACKGDSGGPLMYVVSEEDNVRVYLLGVVSYGFRCAEPGYPGVYTRVTNFIDWIERNMN